EDILLLQIVYEQEPHNKFQDICLGISENFPFGLISLCIYKKISSIFALVIDFQYGIYSDVRKIEAIGKLVGFGSKKIVERADRCPLNNPRFCNPFIHLENALQRALEIAKEKDCDVGAHNLECFKILNERIKNGRLLKLFSPFKDSTTTYSLLFKKYHEDIVDLYNSIINNCEIHNSDENLNQGLIKKKCCQLTKKELIDVPEFKSQKDCKECIEVNEKKEELDQYLEKKNNEKCKEETYQTIMKYFERSRLIEEFSNQEEHEQEADKIWNSLCKQILSENKCLTIGVKLVKEVNEEYTNSFSNYNWIIYYDSNIPNFFNVKAYDVEWYNLNRNVIRPFLKQNDITLLKEKINSMIDQILCKIDCFHSGMVHNTPLCVLDQKKDEYLKKINIHLQYGHSHIYEGHLAGDYLLRVIHRKVINAENRNRIDYVLGISWISDFETIRLKYFIELAEQIYSGDKSKGVEHFLKPQKSIEDYEDIEKFVNNYMTQVDDIDYKLNLKDNLIADNFNLFHAAIVNELDVEKGLNAKENGCYHYHDEDIGETNIHHTCHQPPGLNGVHYIGSNELTAKPCNKYTDEDIKHIKKVKKKWG
ncbi:17143_t:CDS:2, partial [Gigaspora margarita]